MTGWQAVLAALAPSIGVGVLFWLVIRALLNADANERRAAGQMDAAEHPANAKTDNNGRV
jgi:hypothetical protein